MQSQAAVLEKKSEIFPSPIGMPHGSVTRVALVGNPNSGKTTLFNALTGHRYKVGNYPGVTVEKRVGIVRLPTISPSPGSQETSVIDLPGIYTLSGSSLDERITTGLVMGTLPDEPMPDAVIAVIDSTNLERNLYLVTQLIDLELPLLLVLTMSDLAEKQGIRIYPQTLSRLLDVSVVRVVASQRKGLNELQIELQKLLVQKKISSKKSAWLFHQSPYQQQGETLGNLIESCGNDLAKTRTHSLVLGLGFISEAVVPSDDETKKHVETTRGNFRKLGFDPLSFEANGRYRWLHSLVEQSVVMVPRTLPAYAQKIDSVIIHRFWGPLILFGVLGVIFQSIFLWAQLPMEAIQDLFQKFAAVVSDILPDGELKSLIVDGVISGVGSVVVFVPQIAILFFALGLLEDSGYLSRAAFLMDRLMRPFGLQGRSFIPLLSSFACAIPGIMSTRTIASWGDRLVTILVAPLMSCSARLPVYTVLIAAFIPREFFFGVISLQGLVLFAMYSLGIVAAGGVGWILRRTLLRGEPALFVMEIPPFRRPSFRVVIRGVIDRVMNFLKDVGTVILACSIVLWFLASYPRVGPEFQGNKVQQSYAGQLGTLLEPVIRPLGFNWEIGTSILASFAAREVFISSLSTIYNLQGEEDGSESLTRLLAQKKGEGFFSLPTALSLMVFYVFACQCMSTLAVCHRETGSWKWTAFLFCYMTVLAYVASFLVFRIGQRFFLS